MSLSNGISNELDDTFSGLIGVMPLKVTVVAGIVKSKSKSPVTTIFSSNHSMYALLILTGGEVTTTGTSAGHPGSFLLGPLQGAGAALTAVNEVSSIKIMTNLIFVKKFILHPVLFLVRQSLVFVWDTAFIVFT